MNGDLYIVYYLDQIRSASFDEPIPFRSVLLFNHTKKTVKFRILGNTYIFEKRRQTLYVNRDSSNQNEENVYFSNIQYGGDLTGIVDLSFPLEYNLDELATGSEQNTFGYVVLMQVFSIGTIFSVQIELRPRPIENAAIIEELKSIIQIMDDPSQMLK